MKVYFRDSTQNSVACRPHCRRPIGTSQYCSLAKHHSHRQSPDVNLTGRPKMWLSDYHVAIPFRD